MKYVGGTEKGLELAYKLVRLGGDIKITRIDYDGWNDMEGNLYTVRIKATAPQGKVWSSNKRKNMLYDFDTNSTYLEDWYEEDMTDKEAIKEMVYNSVA